MAATRSPVETAKYYAGGAVEALSQRAVFPADMRLALALIDDAARLLRAELARAVVPGATGATVDAL